jgi:guanosine-3',5'-bis(diphosphate) 3'-pyrophosphohydrolase
MNSETDDLLRAISFAARAHRHHLRKDGETPYVSHVFRVCLVVRHVFGIDDPSVLTAAVLHDTIEDTTTDCDDIVEKFGADVAGWVAALTKDKRLEDDERERAYEETLRSAPWQVKACKLADVYDNLLDAENLPRDRQVRTRSRAQRYLAAVSANAPQSLAPAIRKVEELLAQLQTSS